MLYSLKMKKRAIDIIFAILSGILIPFLFISFSAFIPCFFRAFYYGLIDPLKIPETSGYSKDVIIEAYNDVMNYLWNGAPFKTGQLAYTAEEEAHFHDCIPLFHLQLILLIVTGALLLAYFILIQTKVLRPVRFLKMPIVSIGSIVLIVFLLVLGIWAAIDFNSLFTVFHHVAFPGKENWTFNPMTEEVINILPESFFLACAVFIIALTISLSILTIVLGIVFTHKKVKKVMKNETNPA